MADVAALPKTRRSAGDTALAEQTVDTLRGLKSLRGLSDREIGQRASLSRAAVELRMGGKKRIDLDDLERLGQALNVLPGVLLLPRMDALRWVLDHAPTLDSPIDDDRDGVISSSPWITDHTLTGARDTMRTQLVLPLFDNGVVIPMWPRAVPDIDDDTSSEVPAPAPCGDGEVPEAA